MLSFTVSPVVMQPAPSSKPPCRNNLFPAGNYVAAMQNANDKSLANGRLPAMVRTKFFRGGHGWY
jgi:hypothetical protein